ncbi:response regulator [Tenacibaculum piscium]|uniref:response regulator n=1 Tax=Tenacibaculum piscium TaxID=1458515 RepID=UPI001F2B1F1B|nr:response regulator [Tenacibaculum piscium]
MTKNILIVNNDVGISSLIQMMLSSVNTIFKISNSYDDVQMALKNKKYDLIVTDAVINGNFIFQYLEDLKTMASESPIIIISEIDQEDIVRVAKKIGINEFISFPFSKVEINKYVNRYL